jgi:hypothetical protein
MLSALNCFGMDFCVLVVEGGLYVEMVDAFCGMSARLVAMYGLWDGGENVTAGGTGQSPNNGFFLQTHPSDYESLLCFLSSLSHYWR